VQPAGRAIDSLNLVLLALRKIKHVLFVTIVRSWLVGWLTGWCLGAGMLSRFRKGSFLVLVENNLRGFNSKSVEIAPGLSFAMRFRSKTSSDLAG
jgi:hypothetical protein